MSKRKDQNSNIIQFPPEASTAYYERQIDQGNLIIPRSFLGCQLYLAQWFENPQDKAAGFRALTKAMNWPPSDATKFLKALEEVGYAGFPERAPLPEETLEEWRVIVKSILKMPLRQRAILEVLVDQADKSNKLTITSDMITAKYKEIKQRRRTR